MVPSNSSLLPTPRLDASGPLSPDGRLKINNSRLNSAKSSSSVPKPPQKITAWQAQSLSFSEND
ncbi:MAG: hypothetical protein MHPSP_003019, partial [Paramarteilia canceri]